MRILTRPDFDGVVCAVLLFEAENVTEPVKWVEPNDMQRGLVDVQQGDIIANLPYDDRCMLWFDHHHTNKIDKPFEGAFKIAPSAAGVVFDYYKDKFNRDYSELIRITDKIDSADLSLDEVLYPEKYGVVLLSMTVLGRDDDDERYWNRLVYLLRKIDIDEVLKDSEVKARCNAVVEKNKIYNDILKQHTKLKEHVSITDFRSLSKTPTGNRFLVYSMFPEAVVSVKIRYDNEDKEGIAVSVGHSIFNRNCKVNVGRMLSAFEGGGHRAAASCRFAADKADDYIPKIIDILLKNEDNEN
ncbi:MAG: exopolyphosphatase [Thermodesulfobacteriota bacterium]|nr:MAG: exopolyphosphatase [Thermodesulfobacteriota bacterium]